MTGGGGTCCSPAQSCHTVDGHAAAGLFLELQFEQVQPIVHYLVGGRGSVIKRPILKDGGRRRKSRRGRGRLVISHTKTKKQNKRSVNVKTSWRGNAAGVGVGVEGGTSCFHWLHGVITHSLKKMNSVVTEKASSTKKVFGEKQLLIPSS